MGVADICAPVTRASIALPVDDVIGERGGNRRRPHLRRVRSHDPLDAVWFVSLLITLHDPSVDRGIDFLRQRAMVGGSPPADKGKREPMSGKSRQERDVKKVAMMSIKEKRAAKRDKREPSTFVKPRKAARA
ncbi:hypothetical protein [Microbacterium pumilum]|uniref:Uncharacterized protein n=1 Tax=Microbacterium pumilum TaxID=344165 RepID=A0ABP5EKF8_9MICO